MNEKRCLNCKKGFKVVDSEEHDLVTDSICPECFQGFCNEEGIPLEAFLYRFRFPLFVIGPDCRIICANAPGRDSVAKDLNGVHNRPAGEAFECRYAELPEGCGETVHCKSCTIRKTVQATMSTGRPFSRVPAYMDLGDRLGRKAVCHYISTHQVGGVVLLRIDDQAE